MADPSRYPASFSSVFAVRNAQLYHFASDLFCIQGPLAKYVLQPALHLRAAPVPLTPAALIRVLYTDRSDTLKDLDASHESWSAPLGEQLRRLSCLLSFTILIGMCSNGPAWPFQVSMHVSADR